MKPQHQVIDNWKKAHTKRYAFYINMDTERDVFDYLERQPSKRKFLVELIRDRMNKGGN